MEQNNPADDQSNLRRADGETTVNRSGVEPREDPTDSSGLVGTPDSLDSSGLVGSPDPTDSSGLIGSDSAEVPADEIDGADEVEFTVVTVEEVTLAPRDDDDDEVSPGPSAPGQV